MLVLNNLILLKEVSMPACATQKTIADAAPISNLFLPVPDTDFRDFLDEVAQLLRVAPEILTAIEGDLDAHALVKKKLRQEDRKFFESQTADLPELEIEQTEVSGADLALGVGRPRMPAEAVYVFLMLRGFLGSLSTKQSRRFLHESMSLYGWLQSRGLTMPGVTTILDNLNVISQKTRELIFDRQIARILGEGLDDFKALTIDSTSVKANSSWPNDAKILTGLLARVHCLGQKLDVYGLKNFRQGCVPRWLEEMDKLEFQICLAARRAAAIRLSGISRNWFAARTGSSPACWCPRATRLTPSSWFRPSSIRSSAPALLSTWSARMTVMPLRRAATLCARWVLPM
jgi:hypothetical protein